MNSIDVRTIAQKLLDDTDLEVDAFKKGVVALYERLIQAANGTDSKSVGSPEARTADAGTGPEASGAPDAGPGEGPASSN